MGKVGTSVMARYPSWFSICLVFLEFQQFFCLAFVVPSVRSSSTFRSLACQSSSEDHDEADVVSSPVSSSRSIIPKVETGISDLLQKYPKADGRGIKIAILDTGCDLAAAGLQETSDGKPKHLDFLDCTGGGDIDTRKQVTIDTSSNHSSPTTIVGLTGRELKLGEWARGVSEFRLGSVPLYHLLPRSVKKRLQSEQKERYLQKHRILISQTQQSLDDLLLVEKSLKSKDDDSVESIKQKKKELNGLLEHLQKLEYQPAAAPVMDVIVFRDPQDPETFKAVVDLKADGDLEHAIPLAPFGSSRQISELGFGSAVTFCVQIYDHGDTLSIVTDAGSHGTHVAGIAAANFEQGTGTSDKGGVAPGAQILACKIGDGRLGSAETGIGLIRALAAAKKYGCHLVNLSYGEPSWQPDSGRVSEIFGDTVHKWGMTVFTSAGNDGPALSSLGSPGTLSAPITVGAFVSPEMMVDQYSTLPPPAGDKQRLEGTSYHFSSRGPTPDGAFPDLCAPGGAIASVPRHALQGKAQYHGTSMSSPNACGVAACVLSALIENGIPYCSPAELKRGLMNSVTPVAIPDPFAQGAGLISATKAVDYILKNHGRMGQNLTFDIRIPSRQDARGIYIRDEVQLEGPKTFGVTVLPRFNHAIERTSEEMDELLDLEIDLRLIPSQPWVTCPERLVLLSAKERGGQSFSVRLDTSDLSPGAHFATVDAIDIDNTERGSIFQVPITVIVPHSSAIDTTTKLFQLNDKEVVSLKENDIDFRMTYELQPGAPNRRFLTVPPLAEWATIKIKSTDLAPSETSPKSVLLHAIPFVRGDLPNTEIQLKKMINIKEGVEDEYHLRVKGGSTLEVCLQLLWLANPATTSIVADVEFHSLNTRSPTLVSSQPIHVSAAGEYARLGAFANLRAEKIDPSAQLDAGLRTLRPKSYEIVGGSTERDLLPPSDAEKKASVEDVVPPGIPIYDMYLQYGFSLKGNESVTVVPSFPSLFRQLYDSPLDSQVWVLKDSNSQVLGYGSSMHDADAISLEKGNYTITFHTRHPDRNTLEQVKDLPCQLKFTLSKGKELECKIYGQIDKASTPAVTGDGREALKSMTLPKGSHRDIYIARPTAAIPSFVEPGDVLSGTFVLNKDMKEATSIELLYTVPPKAAAKKIGAEDASEKKNGEEEKSLDDLVFDCKVSHLSKLGEKDQEAFQALAAELQAEKSDSVPLLLELLTNAEKSNTTTPSRLQEIQNVFDMMKSSNGGPIDEVEIAQYFGVSLPDKDELQKDKEAEALKKKMEEHKKALKRVLLAVAEAHKRLADEDSSKVDDFDASVKHLKKWASGMGDYDSDQDKLSVSMVLSSHAVLCQKNRAEALSLLSKAKNEFSLNSDKCKKITDEIIKIYDSMENNAHHVSEMIKNEMLNRFPVTQQGFGFKGARD